MIHESPDLSAGISAAVAHARAHLLAERNLQGHWEGELSSSALATAVSVFALAAFERSSVAASAELPSLRRLCERGLRWLAEHQNPDGGWGDTVLSTSNISTTALCWAAFSIAPSDYCETVAAGEAWLQQAIDQAVPARAAVRQVLDPSDLAAAIRRRYGADHTFAVPILTTLALAGRLGPAASAWRLVPQLPFELAVCPHAWYARLKLPVVSYALPALIAIGQVRFHRAPGRNPLLVLLRRAARNRTLRILSEIQPDSGGYLEAVPLTAFVCMSLIGAERASHPVVRRGVAFLVKSVRDDGSWPIDTNLATWVTTLSIGAFAARGRGDSVLPGFDSDLLRQWLLAQQYRIEHPYTHAAPGGWAWTDLAGGVPDADDTSGALLALHVLDDGSPAVASAAEAAIRWLLDLQNSDGGVPTFCRGWGTLPFDRSSADITAHALRAWACWRSRMPPAIQDRIRRATTGSLRFLVRAQQSDGAWAPLWFGNQHAPDEQNLVYGTTRVLLALACLADDAAFRESVAAPARVACQWLLTSQNVDGGWGGAAVTPSSTEETALALDALATVLANCELTAALDAALVGRLRAAVSHGTAALIRQTGGGREFPPSPIGYYFAKLWYFERLYPVIYAVTALERVRGLVDRAPVSHAARAAV